MRWEWGYVVGVRDVGWGGGGSFSEGLDVALGGGGELSVGHEGAPGGWG